MRKRISARTLQPGIELPGTLYAKNGKVLLKAGTRLGPAQLLLVTEFVDDGLFGDESWPDKFTAAGDSSGTPPSNTGRATSISVSSLKSGMRLTQDIYDARSDVLLLAAGFQVTPRFLKLLESRGIKTITVKPREHRQAPRKDSGSDVAEPQARALEALLEDELKKRIPFRDIGPTERPRLALDDLKHEANEGVVLHAETAEVVATVCDSLRRGREVSGTAINAALDGFVKRATMDIDLLPMVTSLYNASDEYLFEHCVNVALLSMSMAAQAGLATDKIMEIGFGGLLQDVGMMRVPEEIRLAARPLTPEEREEVDRHPLYTVEWLSNVNLAPLTAGIIVYQSHERADGYGFPRGTGEARIHPFARIVSVADTYAAMTADRPYRPAWRPYEASKEILTNLGRFDRATARLFLDTVGLFPIGSLVELTNGMRGRVTRIIPGAHTRPVIELIDPKGVATGRLINLAVEDDLKVVRAFHRSSLATEERVIEPTFG